MTAHDAFPATNLAAVAARVVLVAALTVPVVILMFLSPALAVGLPIAWGILSGGFVAHAIRGEQRFAWFFVIAVIVGVACFLAFVGVWQYGCDHNPYGCP